MKSTELRTIEAIQFENPIAKVSIETGKGFCRFEEFLDNIGSYVSAWTRYVAAKQSKPECRATTGETVSAPCCDYEVYKPKEKPKKPKKQEKKGMVRKNRDLSDVFHRKKTG